MSLCDSPPSYGIPFPPTATPDQSPSKPRSTWRTFLRRRPSTSSCAAVLIPTDDDPPPVPILLSPESVSTASPESQSPKELLPVELVESDEDRSRRVKWAKAKRRIHAFVEEVLEDAGGVEEWSLRVIRDGGDEGPSVLEMTPLGSLHRLPPKESDGLCLGKDGTWLLRECTATPTGAITKTAWRVNGLRGFPHGVFVEFRRKEKKERSRTIVTREPDEDGEDGLVPEGQGSWFRRGRSMSTMSSAKSVKSAKG
ncbi:hypothetical protein P7C70_g8804, partial [Phenoliferia sp. Uapishka_3]